MTSKEKEINKIVEEYIIIAFEKHSRQLYVCLQMFQILFLTNIVINALISKARAHFSQNDSTIKILFPLLRVICYCVSNVFIVRAEWKMNAISY